MLKKYGTNCMNCYWNIKEWVEMQNKSALYVLVLSLVWGCSAPVVKKEIIWPVPPEKPRVQFVEMLKDDGYFPKPFFETLLGGVFGSPVGDALMKPYGVVTDSVGRIYVTDTGLGGVLVFDKVQKKTRTIGTSGQGKLSLPVGITIADSIIFVSDTKLKRVFGYDFEGNLKIAIGQLGEFEAPSGLAYEPSSKRLYVVDVGKHRIRVYKASGDSLFTFGGRGSDTARFNYPTNITVRNKKVYVMDTMNFRVQVFSLDGTFISMFGSVGNRPGYFSRPKGIAVSTTGLIFVTDAAFDNFQIFDEKGQVYLFIGGPGNELGTFNLPAGMYIDNSDMIYVVDQLNHRIQVFKLLGGS